MVKVDKSAYKLVMSRVLGEGICRLDSGRAHLVKVDKSAYKLVMYRVLGEGICNIGSFLIFDFSSYYPRYDGRVLMEPALLS